MTKNLRAIAKSQGRDRLVVEKIGRKKSIYGPFDLDSARRVKFQLEKGCIKNAIKGKGKKCSISINRF